MTPTRIVRFFGFIGLAVFMGLVAKTSTATQALNGDRAVPPPPPIVSGVPTTKKPRIILASQVDGPPVAPSAPAESPAIEVPPPTAPTPMPTDLLPPHEPSPAATKDKDKAKNEPKPESLPEAAPIPRTAEPKDDLLPLTPHLSGDDFPSVDAAPLNIDPAKTSQPPATPDFPAAAPAPAPVARPAPIERPSAQPAPASRVSDFDQDEIPTDDPDSRARSFVERNQKEAEAQLQALNAEAEQLRARLNKLESGIKRWQALADAMRKSQDTASTKKQAPKAVVAETERPIEPKGPTIVETAPSRRAVIISEPQPQVMTRAQFVPAPLPR